MDPSFELKMQAKQLEHEARRMQKDANKQRALAKKELKKGNKPAATLYAQNAVTYERQANMLLQNAAAANGYSIDVRAGEVNAKMANNMSKATTALNQNAGKVDIGKLAAKRTQMDGLKNKMQAANELIIGGEPEEITAGTDDLLAQLEAENVQEAMIQVSEIPGSTGIPSDPVYANPTKF